MLCRVADEIFWMSRNVERATAVARLVDYTWHLELDSGYPDQDDSAFWAPLLGSDGEPGFLPLDSATAATPREVRYRLAFDADNPDSLLSCIRQARAAARGVRESISSEMWEHLNTLYLSLVDPELAARAEDNPHGFYKRIREAAQFFQGLADCTLARDEVWQFTRLGKYLERADNVARVLSLQAHLLLTGEHGEDLVRWLAVLRSCGSAEAYARYYSLRVEPARVVEFLLLNPIFPQSVRFSLGAAWEALGAIGHSQGISHDSAIRASRALGMLSAQLEHAAVDEVLEEGLQPYLASIRNRIAGISEHVTRGYLRDEPQPGRLVAVARAAMIMAAQQQQQ